MGNKKFLNYINNFRGIAITYITLGHCISAFSWPEDSILLSFMLTFVRGGTVLFVFIAGYLFQHLSYKFAYKRYMKAKMLNVISPYLIMSIPAVLYFTTVSSRPSMAYVENLPWLSRVIEYYVTGAQLAPYWFIPMIFVHFLLSPVYIWGDRNNVLYYLLPVFFLLSLSEWNIGRTPFNIDSYPHFAFVYFLGMWASRYRERLNSLLKQDSSLVLSAFLIAALTCYEMFVARNSTVNFIQHLLQCMFILGLLLKYDHLIGSLFDKLAALSFGIYFFHSYFITIFKMLYKSIFGALPTGSVLSMTVLLGCVLVFCTASIQLVKRYSNGRSRQICGV